MFATNASLVNVARCWLRSAVPFGGTGLDCTGPGSVTRMSGKPGYCGWDHMSLAGSSGPIWTSPSRRVSCIPAAGHSISVVRGNTTPLSGSRKWSLFRAAATNWPCASMSWSSRIHPLLASRTKTRVIGPVGPTSGLRISNKPSFLRKGP